MRRWPFAHFFRGHFHSHGPDKIWPLCFPFDGREWRIEITTYHFHTSFSLQVWMRPISRRRKGQTWFWWKCQDLWWKKIIRKRGRIVSAWKGADAPKPGKRTQDRNWDCTSHSSWVISIGRICHFSAKNGLIRANFCGKNPSKTNSKERSQFEIANCAGIFSSQISKHPPRVHWETKKKRGRAKCETGRCRNFDSPLPWMNLKVNIREEKNPVLSFDFASFFSLRPALNLMTGFSAQCKRS